MMTTKLLVLVTLGWPLLLLAGLLWRSTRRFIPTLLGTAPWPVAALMLWGTANTSVTLLPFRFQWDTIGGFLLIAAAILWSIGGFTMPSYFPNKRPRVLFIVCWLLTLLGNLGVFLADDLITFLVFYALVSLPAYGLIIYERTPEALRAGKIYLGFALLGENLLLLAFVLLTHGTNDMQLHTIASGFLIAGFGAKIALLPLHFWMSPSYTAAPIPAAAMLSGAAVKAGIIGLLRFLPIEFTAVSWGNVLMVLGFCGAFYGVLLGLTQRHPKTILAYSSISQMGFLAAILGIGISTADESVTLLAAFYGAHHTLAKGALFLALGACAIRPTLTLAPAALIGLGLAGLPLTGGSLAKLAVKAPLGYGTTATLATLASVGTAVLMAHFLFRMADMQKTPHAPTPRRLLPWLASAFACLIFPWVTFPIAGLSLTDILTLENLWKTLWPVLAGVMAALLLRRIHRPEIPAGDLLVLLEKTQPSIRSLASSIVRLDSLSRRWSVACSLVLALAVTLALLLALDTSSP